jgi:hypothetical protein
VSEVDRRRLAAELVERESLTREELDRLVAAPAETPGVPAASHAA